MGSHVLRALTRTTYFPASSAQNPEYFRSALDATVLQYETVPHLGKRRLTPGGKAFRQHLLKDAGLFSGSESIRGPRSASSARQHIGPFRLAEDSITTHPTFSGNPLIPELRDEQGRPGKNHFSAGFVPENEAPTNPTNLTAKGESAMQKLVRIMVIAAVSTLSVATMQVATAQNGHLAGAASGPGLPYPKLPPIPPSSPSAVSVAGAGGPGLPYPKLPPIPPSSPSAVSEFAAGGPGLPYPKLPPIPPSSPSAVSVAAASGPGLPYPKLPPIPPSSPSVAVGRDFA